MDKWFAKVFFCCFGLIGPRKFVNIIWYKNDTIYNSYLSLRFIILGAYMLNGSFYHGFQTYIVLNHSDIFHSFKNRNLASNTKCGRNTHTRRPAYADVHIWKGTVDKKVQDLLFVELIFNRNFLLEYEHIHSFKSQNLAEKGIALHIHWKWPHRPFLSKTGLTFTTNPTKTPLNRIRIQSIQIVCRWKNSINY